MAFLPQSYVAAGYGAFGHNPWPWPSLPNGGQLVILRAESASWSAAFSKAIVQQSANPLGGPVSPVAPAHAYLFNFDTGQFVGEYQPGDVIFPSLPTHTEPDRNIYVVNPDGSKGGVLTAADLAPPTPPPPPPPPSGSGAIPESDPDTLVDPPTLLPSGPTQTVMPQIQTTADEAPKPASGAAPGGASSPAAAAAPGDTLRAVPMWAWIGIGIAAVLAMRKR